MKKKLEFEDLRGLASYSMRTNTFGSETADTMTIRQFCAEIRAEMEYQYECDERQGLNDREDLK